MLVAIDDIRMPVGIVACEWKIDGDIQYFVLLPYRINNQNFIEVEVPGPVKIISKTAPGWQWTDDGFGDNAAGYLMNEQTKTDLYRVWDNGSDVEIEASQRLYSSFNGVIEHYQEIANKYLKSLAENEYSRAAAEAKANGWDVGLIKKKSLTFPYFRSGE